MSVNKKKKITSLIKLQIAAGKANPSPPVGPALGQRGVNIMEFCKQFNEKTKDLEPGMPIPVIITVYHDKSFSFITKTPPTSYLILKESGIQKGSQAPGRDWVGNIEKGKVKKIAEMKLSDMGIDSLEGAMAMVEGTALSMGIKVV